MQTTVSDQILQASDRLYDVVDEALLVLKQSPTHRLLALDGLRFQLQRAKDAYDDALNAEAAEVAHA